MLTQFRNSLLSMFVVLFFLPLGTVIVWHLLYLRWATTCCSEQYEYISPQICAAQAYTHFLCAEQSIQESDFSLQLPHRTHGYTGARAKPFLCCVLCRVIMGSVLMQMDVKHATTEILICYDSDSWVQCINTDHDCIIKKTSVWQEMTLAQLLLNSI